MPERPRHVANDPLPMRPGRAWIVSHHPYETPAGLPHNSPVEIVKMSPRVPGFNFTVRDDSGQEWRLGVGQVT